MSKAQAHRTASQEFQVGDDSRFRTYLQNLQHPDQKTFIQDLADHSPKLMKLGWELAAASKQRQIDAANAKQLGLDLDADDASSFATEEDTEYWTKLEELKGISFDSVEKSRQLFEKGIPRDYAVLGKNLTLIEQQNLRKQQYNTALAGLPGYVGKWTTAQFDDEGKLIPGLRIRLNDGRIVDATDETLSRADFAEVEEFITAKYLQPVLSSDGKGVEFQREHLNKPLAEIKAGLLKDHVKTANELAEYNDRQTYKNFLTQNAGKLTAEDLGGMLSLSGLFTNDKGKPFSNTERQEYLTEFIKDLAKTSPDTARALVQNMEETGYTVGGVNKKFGSQRIDSLNEFINKELTTQENDDYNAFKAGSNSLGIQFRREYRAAQDADARNEVVKKYQGLYSNLGPWATGTPSWITNELNIEKADKESQKALALANGYISPQDWDSLHPELKQELQHLKGNGERIVEARQTTSWTKREQSLESLLNNVEGIQALKGGGFSDFVAQQTFLKMLPDFEEQFERNITLLKLPPDQAHDQALGFVSKKLGNPADLAALKNNPYYKEYIRNSQQSAAKAPYRRRAQLLENAEEAFGQLKSADLNVPWVNDKGQYRGIELDFLELTTDKERREILKYSKGEGDSDLIYHFYKEYTTGNLNPVTIDVFTDRMVEAITRRIELDDQAKAEAKRKKGWAFKLLEELRNNGGFGTRVIRDLNRLSSYRGAANWVSFRSKYGLFDSMTANTTLEDYNA